MTTTESKPPVTVPLALEDVVDVTPPTAVGRLLAKNLALVVPAMMGRAQRRHRAAFAPLVTRTQFREGASPEERAQAYTDLVDHCARELDNATGRGEGWCLDHLTEEEIVLAYRAWFEPLAVPPRPVTVAEDDAGNSSRGGAGAGTPDAAADAGDGEDGGDGGGGGGGVGLSARPTSPSGCSGPGQTGPVSGLPNGSGRSSSPHDPPTGASPPSPTSACGATPGEPSASSTPTGAAATP